VKKKHVKVYGNAKLPSHFWLEKAARKKQKIDHAYTSGKIMKMDEARISRIGCEQVFLYGVARSIVEMWRNFKFRIQIRNSCKTKLKVIFLRHISCYTSPINTKMASSLLLY